MKSTPIVVLFSVAHFAHHLSTGVLVPLLPLLRQDFGLNYLQAGVLVSAFTVSFGFGQLPAALLADRFSSRALIVLGLIGTAVSSMAVSLTRTYWQMIPCFIVLGLVGATYHAPVSSFLSQRVSAGQRGRSLGTHVIGGSASFLVTPVLVVYLATWADTWRLPFLVMGLPTLMMGVLVWLATRTPRADGDELRTRQVTEYAKPVAVTDGAEPDGHPTGAPHQVIAWRQIARAIGVLAAISVFMQMAFSSIYAYLPLYLTDSRGVTPEVAAIAISLVAGMGVVGAPLGGALSDRLGRKRVILLSLALAGPMLLVVTRAPAGIWLMLSLATYGIVISARMPAMESLVADVVPPRQRATVLGTYYLLGQESAGVATPLVGRLVDLAGIHPVFTGLAVGFCLLSAVAVALRKRI